MLLADKDRVEYDNKQNLLTLQYSEMDYHLSRCLTLGLQSTLVAETLNKWVRGQGTRAR